MKDKYVEMNPNNPVTKPKNIVIGTVGKTKIFAKSETIETLPILQRRYGATKICVDIVVPTISFTESKRKNPSLFDMGEDKRIIPRVARKER